MARYRKKPVEIEAVRFLGVDQVDNPGKPMLDCVDTYPYWLTEALQKPQFTAGSAWTFDKVLQIQTLEGSHQASPGDWIIRGIAGEIYPCKPQIFAATYDVVSQ